MSRNIPGRLDTGALAAFTGTHATDESRMRHFHCLDRSRQAEAIRRLHTAGWTEHGIAHATKLSVEMIRRVLDDRCSTAAADLVPESTAAASRQPP